MDTKTTIILLYGLPGVGKQTVGEELEKLTGLPLLNNHLVLDIVQKFIPKEFPEGKGVEKGFRIDLLNGVLKTKLKGMIITFTCGSSGAEEFIKECVACAETHNGAIHLVELQCSMDELVKRIKEPSRLLHTKISTEEELQEFLEQPNAKASASRPATIIDNSNLPPKDCAALIAQKLQL